MKDIYSDAIYFFRRNFVYTKLLEKNLGKW
jgi:hypothetical protein